jgi:hypothetical protein
MAGCPRNNKEDPKALDLLNDTKIIYLEKVT